LNSVKTNFNLLSVHHKLIIPEQRKRKAIKLLQSFCIFLRVSHSFPSFQAHRLKKIMSSAPNWTQDYTKIPYSGNIRQLIAFQQSIAQDIRKISGNFLIDDDRDPPFLQPALRAKVVMVPPQQLTKEELQEHRFFKSDVEKREQTAESCISLLRSQVTTQVYTNFTAVESLPASVMTAVQKFKSMWQLLSTRYEGTLITQGAIIENIQDDIKSIATSAQSDADAEAKLNTLLTYERELNTFAGGSGKMTMAGLHRKIIAILDKEKYSSVINQMTQLHLTTVNEILQIFLDEAQRLRNYHGGGAVAKVSFSSSATSQPHLPFQPPPPSYPAPSAQSSQSLSMGSAQTTVTISRDEYEMLLRREQKPMRDARSPGAEDRRATRSPSGERRNYYQRDRSRERDPDPQQDHRNRPWERSRSPYRQPNRGWERGPIAENRWNDRDRQPQGEWRWQPRGRSPTPAGQRG